MPLARQGPASPSPFAARASEANDWIPLLGVRLELCASVLTLLQGTAYNEDTDKSWDDAEMAIETCVSPDALPLRGTPMLQLLSPPPANEAHIRPLPHRNLR